MAQPPHPHSRGGSTRVALQRPVALSSLAIETNADEPHEPGAKSSGGKARCSSGSGKRSAGRRKVSPYAREPPAPTPSEALRAQMGSAVLADASATAEDDRPVSARTRSKWRSAAAAVRSSSVLEQWKIQASKKTFDGAKVLSEWREQLPPAKGKGKSILSQW